MHIDTTNALARQALDRLGRSNLTPAEYLHEVSAQVRRVVPHVGSAWLTLDPDTMLSSGTLVTDQPPEVLETLWRNELLDGDVHKLPELATRRLPVAALSQLDPATMGDSPRLQLIHRPSGIGDELRVMLRAGGSTWGHAGLCREIGDAGFDSRERAFVADVADVIALGLRRSLSCRTNAGDTDLAPGVVAYDVYGRAISETREASRIVALMPEAAVTLYSVAIGAAQRDCARARVRLTNGRWVLLQGGRMHGARAGSAGVTVSLTPAPRADLTSLLLRLHGLSAREREVTELLMGPPRTDEVAAQLHISRHTLRDHIKSIFAKLAVRSRSELTALAHGHLPRAS